MNLIERLSEMIDEEISDARKYALCYQEHKDFEPELARTFSILANEELNHMKMLHDQVVRIIGDYRKANGEPPANMMAIYDYLHKRQIEKVAEVKALLA